MEIEILEEKENPFFKRKEVKVEVKHPGKATPSKTELIEELASKYSVAKDCIKIDYIFTKKGVPSSFAKVKIEKSEEVKSEAQASETK